MIIQKHFYVKPSTKQKPQKIKTFFEPHVFEDISNILYKMLKPISNPAIKKKWIAYSNSLLPKKSLEYTSQAEYLKNSDLSKETIVKNTILYIFPNYNELDLQFLTKEFMIFTKKATVIICTLKSGKELVVYREILHSLVYAKKIREMIDKNNKMRSSSHLGLKRSSNWKALVRSEKAALENRLSHPYFPLTSEDEIAKTKLHIKYLELVLDKDYKILIDLFHLANIYFGLDYPLLNLSQKEQEHYIQLLNLFNGLKTSDDELLESATIFLRMQSKITDKNDYKELSKSIFNIIIQLFNDVYLKGVKRRGKRTNHFTYTESHVDKTTRIKTFMNETPIYTYSKKTYFDFMHELFELFEKTTQGIKNVFEPDLPEENKASSFTILRNIAEIKKEFNITKREIKSFHAITKNYNQDSEQISNLLTSSQ